MSPTVSPYDISHLSSGLRDDIAQHAARHAILPPEEAAWRDKQPFLESRGYMLRRRYHPTWVPTWNLPENANINPSSFEDYILPPPVLNLMDAMRISDGRLVYIKRLTTDSEEIRIAQMFSTDELAQDVRNHCIPVLDVLRDDVNPQISYLIMPFLRAIHDPPFETVSDVIGFVDQILEGLTFMHDQGVAHRDCSRRNLMMDANALFPEGFHPVRTLYDPTAMRSVEPLRRTGNHITYYFVDFGISVRILPGQPKLALGGHGLDQDPPELSFRIPYDLFKLDIFIVGNMLRKEFYDSYSNADFLWPLIYVMTQLDPSDRPDAAAAQQRWGELKAELSEFRQSWRLKHRSEVWPQTLVLDSIVLLGRGARVGKGLFKWVSDLQG